MNVGSAAFSVARLPRIEFGAGRAAIVPELAARYGTRALLVTGARSFTDSPAWPSLRKGLAQHGVGARILRVAGEPSPALVDDAVTRFTGDDISVVIAVGGGSVLDAGKAIAGLLPHGNSVLDHLEGVGRGLPYAGPATPLIAVPTTAGTGSEATRNAVLSQQGEGGFKKSFRHEALVPDFAVVDPELLGSCPPAQIAANGMDALTQLIESFVSARANPFTDALALSGIRAIADGFANAHAGGGGEDARRGRAGMAYGALLSGITLAQVGLGSVHGLASPLGAFFPIPHGVVCGTLLAEATRVNLAALAKRDPQHPSVAKYRELGTLLGGDPDALVDYLEALTARLELPRLRDYGVAGADVARIVADSRGSSMQTNPVLLTDEEIAAIVQARL